MISFGVRTPLAASTDGREDVINALLISCILRSVIRLLVPLFLSPCVPYLLLTFIII